MEAGETFPAIKVGQLRNVPKLILLDGRHTVEALKKRGAEYYSGELYQYETEREMFADAVRFNAKHGRALGKDDERLIVERLQEYKFSVEEIQKIIHVPASEIKSSFPTGDSYTVTSPSGRKTIVKPTPKIDMHAGIPAFPLPQISSVNDRPLKIVEFKNNLRRVISFLETERLPDDIESKEMIKKIRELMIIEAD